jgi:hypothetical protein
LGNVFGNKVGRETFFEPLFVFERVVHLGKGHAAAFEPAVQHVFYAAGGAAVFSFKHHVVYVGAVQVNHVIGVDGKFFEFFNAAGH